MSKSVKKNERIGGTLTSTNPSLYRIVMDLTIVFLFIVAAVFYFGDHARLARHDARLRGLDARFVSIDARLAKAEETIQELRSRNYSASSWDYDLSNTVYGGGATEFESPDNVQRRKRRLIEVDQYGYPVVPIKIDHSSHALSIGGSVDIKGDIMIRGRLFADNFTKVDARSAASIRSPPTQAAHGTPPYNSQTLTPK